ncbi:MAG: hypothetical protein RR049_07180, partial [Angelakisella sp.]
MSRKKKKQNKKLLEKAYEDKSLNGWSCPASEPEDSDTDDEPEAEAPAPPEAPPPQDAPAPPGG